MFIERTEKTARSEAGVLVWVLPDCFLFISPLLLPLYFLCFSAKHTNIIIFAFTTYRETAQLIMITRLTWEKVLLETESTEAQISLIISHWRYMRSSRSLNSASLT